MAMGLAIQQAVLQFAYVDAIIRHGVCLSDVPFAKHNRVM
jgi:hypothetical protein